jgi:hypothetical protein
MQIGADSRIGNAITFLSIGAFTAGSANTVGNSQIGYGFVAGAASVASDNTIGYYFNGTTNKYGIPGVSGVARQATNYYAFVNDDPIAQMALGSVRSAHTYTALLTGQTGNVTIDKNTGQTQILELTGNVDIVGYSNFVTTVTDGVNTKKQADTVTILIAPTSSTVTLPAASSTYLYLNGNATVPTSASDWVKITVTGTDYGGTVYLTTIEQFS